MSNFDGIAEVDALFAAIGAYAGGQVFDTEVDDFTALARYSTTDDRVKPYIVVQTNDPFASTQGRAIAGGEQAQPHVLMFTITVLGGKIKDVRAVTAALANLLLDMRLTPTSSPLRKTGGFSYSQAKTENAPSRKAIGSYYKTYINL